MSFLQNAKVRTKILSLIIPLCLIGITGVLVVSRNYKQADTAYSSFIAKDNVAVVQMARAAQRLTALSYAAYQIMVYDANSPELSKLVSDYRENVSGLQQRFTIAKTLLPSQSSAIDKFVTDANAIVVLTDRAVAAGMLENDKEATAFLKQADPMVDAEITQIRIWMDADIKAMSDTSLHLQAETNDTIYYSLTVLAAVFLAAIVAALWVCANGITSPIERLRARMLSLAHGETDESVYGLARRDEVGQMASAVAVFRDNAIAKMEMEIEADSNRNLSERERMERQAQKERDTEDSQFAVDNLGTGLSHLSNGDVAYRIQTPFVSHLDSLRVDFNRSLDALQQALQEVGKTHAV